jgi:D-inositol-3-phosphate glycosyltransferase
MGMRIAMVSVPSGRQDPHVAALARGLGARGNSVVVHTRRGDPGPPRQVHMAPGVVVDHVAAGPPQPIAKDLLFPYMEEFAADLRRQWWASRPDVVHSHFWMSGYAAVRAARPLGIPVLHTFHALGVIRKREQGVRDTSPPERHDVETGLMHAVDRALATCPEEVFELLRRGADRGRVGIVPCGVDAEHAMDRVVARTLRAYAAAGRSALAAPEMWA